MILSNHELILFNRFILQFHPGIGMGFASYPYLILLIHLLTFKFTIGMKKIGELNRVLVLDLHVYFDMYRMSQICTCLFYFFLWSLDTDSMVYNLSVWSMWNIQYILWTKFRCFDGIKHALTSLKTPACQIDKPP